LVEAG